MVSLVHRQGVNGKAKLVIEYRASRHEIKNSRAALLGANPDRRARFARTSLRECRVAALLGAMEHAGIGFDVAYARRVVTRFRDEIETVERAADALAVEDLL